MGKKQNRKMTQRVKQMLESRRAELRDSLLKDFENTIFEGLSKLSDKELSKTRKMDVTYEINNGKLSRISEVLWQGINSKGKFIQVKECKFGFYLDAYRAFIDFKNDLYLDDMFIVKPELPLRDCEKGRVTFKVYFE
ncbi:MAG: hypothetical protein K6D97_07985 [Clostridia bacterium]|nr:hypothetical protein [Clostridia bacterium]